MIIVTIYMCSHCTRVHNAAHECEQHEREDHAPRKSTKSVKKSIEGPSSSKRSKPTIYDHDEESDLRDRELHVDDVQFFNTDYSSDDAEDPHAAQTSADDDITNVVVRGKIRERPSTYRRHTNEYKLEVINQMREDGDSLSAASRKFGINRATITDWMKKRAEIEMACSCTPQLKNSTRSGPRQNDRIDSWRDSVVVAYLQHREAVGDPVKQTLICTIARQVHKTIAEQLGVRSILKSSETYLKNLRRLMTNPTPPNNSNEMVTWTFENSGASNAENAQITLPVYEFAAEIQTRINDMRSEYREMMQVWNGDLPAPTLPQLPFHYMMAWPHDEEGAPLRDKRTENYDENPWPRARDRKKDGADMSVTVTPQSKHGDNEEVNVAQSWSVAKNGVS